MNPRCAQVLSALCFLTATAAAQNYQLAHEAKVNANVTSYLLIGPT